jgi:hypothetical protein
MEHHILNFVRTPVGISSTGSKIIYVAHYLVSRRDPHHGVTVVHGYKICLCTTNKPVYFKFSLHLI